MTGRTDYEAIVRSIEDVTDPTKNSINEKCARIREAFYKEFRSDIAEFYCINGRCYKPKTIELERSKVEFEDKTFLQDLQRFEVLPLRESKVRILLQAPTGNWRNG